MPLRYALIGLALFCACSPDPDLVTSKRLDSERSAVTTFEFKKNPKGGFICLPNLPPKTGEFDAAQIQKSPAPKKVGAGLSN